MKKLLTLSLLVLSLSPLSPVHAAKTPPEKVYTIAQLSGNLLLEKNSDRIWYAEPLKKTRYIIRDDADIAWLRDNLTVSVTRADFAKMPDGATATTKKYTGKYSGRLVSAISDPSDSWYLSPVTGKRYAMDTFSAMQQLAKDTGITVGPKSLAKLSMTKKQVMFDPVNAPLAYVSYDGERFSGGNNAKTILPLASLTKLMTALVVLDTGIDFEKVVTVTPEEIHYPKTLVGDDATSEVDLKAGDQVKLQDLWISMLLASSNQSAVILADATGLSRESFVKKMNEKAEYFKLSHTRFSEMAGLNPNNVTTAEEMAILAHRAFGSYRIAEPSVRNSYAFTVKDSDGGSRTVQVTNRNYSLLAFGPSAAKTGYLTEAQRNVAVKKHGKIVVVLHALSMKQRNQILELLLP